MEAVRMKNGGGEDEEWRRARRMKGAEEGSGGASLGLRQSHCDRDAFARVGSVGLHGCVAGMKGNENRKIGLQGRLTSLLQGM